MSSAEATYSELFEAEAHLAWLLVAGLSAVSIVIGLCILLPSRSLRSVALVQLWSTSSLALCAIAAVDLLVGLSGSLSGAGLWLCRGVILSAAIALAALVLPRRMDDFMRKGAWLRTVVIPAFIGLTATGWASHRVVNLNSSERQSFEDTLVEAAEINLSTDRGSRVPAYRSRLSSDDIRQRRALRMEPVPAVSEQAWEQTAPDPQSDCHGWVFAGGQYVIRSESIEQILEDNGYERVDQPRGGDLIVYRDHENDIVHTGTVKATGESGFVLIESKWGFGSCYLHEPEQQRFSKRYDYYRSPRLGHDLRSKLHADEVGLPSRPGVFSQKL
jgi:hypothetical protein